MKRALLFIGVGLISAIVFIPAMFVLSTYYRGVEWIVGGPAWYMKRYIVEDAVISLFGPIGQASHHGLAFLLMLIFWWLLFSLSFWMLYRLRARRQRRIAAGTP